MASGGVESIRRNFSLSTRIAPTQGIPGWQSLAKMQPLLDRLSVHGQIGVLEPEPVITVHQKARPSPTAHREAETAKAHRG